VRELHYIQLGATLFLPANHKNLPLILQRQKYQELKSVVIDFEDALEEDSRAKAFANFAKILKHYKQTSLLVFVRPYDAEMLASLLNLEGIQQCDGFIFAKFGLHNAKSYLSLVENQPFYIMPSIEGKELFSAPSLEKLSQLLLTSKTNILLVRFGLEDMLRALGMQRGCDKSVFDYSVTSYVLGQFLAVFKGAGFGVSGGVFPCFSESQKLHQDVMRDLQEGLFTKTVIHPSQIDVVHQAYRVTRQEYENALEILQTNKAILNQNNTMAERTTRTPYAQQIVLRAKEYGVK